MSDEKPGPDAPHVQFHRHIVVEGTVEDVKAHLEKVWLREGQAKVGGPGNVTVSCVNEGWGELA